MGKKNSAKKKKAGRNVHNQIDGIRYCLRSRQVDLPIGITNVVKSANSSGDLSFLSEDYFNIVDSSHDSSLPKVKVKKKKRYGNKFTSTGNSDGVSEIRSKKCTSKSVSVEANENLTNFQDLKRPNSSRSQSKSPIKDYQDRETCYDTDTIPPSQEFNSGTFNHSNILNKSNNFSKHKTTSPFKIIEKPNELTSDKNVQSEFLNSELDSDSNFKTSSSTKNNLSRNVNDNCKESSFDEKMNSSNLILENNKSFKRKDSLLSSPAKGNKGMKKSMEKQTIGHENSQNTIEKHLEQNDEDFDDTENGTDIFRKSVSPIKNPKSNSKIDESLKNKSPSKISRKRLSLLNNSAYFNESQPINSAKNCALDQSNESDGDTDSENDDNLVIDEGDIEIPSIIDYDNSQNTIENSLEQNNKEFDDTENGIDVFRKSVIPIKNPKSNSKIDESIKNKSPLKKSPKRLSSSKYCLPNKSAYFTENKPINSDKHCALDQSNESGGVTDSENDDNLVIDEEDIEIPEQNTDSNDVREIGISCNNKSNATLNDNNNQKLCTKSFLSNNTETSDMSLKDTQPIESLDPGKTCSDQDTDDTNRSNNSVHLSQQVNENSNDISKELHSSSSENQEHEQRKTETRGHVKECNDSGVQSETNSNKLDTSMREDSIQTEDTLIEECKLDASKRNKRKLSSKKSDKVQSPSKKHRLITSSNTDSENVKISTNNFCDYNEKDKQNFNNDKVSFDCDESPNRSTIPDNSTISDKLIISLNCSTIPDNSTIPSKIDSLTESRNLELSRNEFETEDSNNSNKDNDNDGVRNKNAGNIDKNISNIDSKSLENTQTEKSSSNVNSSYSELKKHKKKSLFSLENMSKSMSPLYDEDSSVDFAKLSQPTSITDCFVNSDSQSDSLYEESSNIITIKGFKINVAKLVSKAIKSWTPPNEVMKKVRQVDMKLLLNGEEMFEKCFKNKYKCRRFPVINEKALRRRWIEFCRLYSFDSRKPKYFFHNVFTADLFPKTFRKYFICYLSQDQHEGLTSRAILNNFENIFRNKVFSEHFMPKEDSVIMALDQKFHSKNMKKYVHYIGSYVLNKSYTSVMRRRRKLIQNNKKSFKNKSSDFYSSSDDEILRKNNSNNKNKLKHTKRTSKIHKNTSKQTNINKINNKEISANNNIDTEIHNNPLLKSLEERYETFSEKSQVLTKLLDKVLDLSGESKTSIMNLKRNTLSVKDWRHISTEISKPAHIAKAIYQCAIHPLLFSTKAYNKHQLVLSMLDFLKSEHLKCWSDVNWSKLSEKFDNLTPLFLFTTFVDVAKDLVPIDLQGNFTDCINCLLEKRMILEEMVTDGITLDICK